MEDNPFNFSYRSALQDFRNARRDAAMQEIWGRLTGKPSELLSFEEVSKQLRASASNRRVLKEIPLDAIVGSVGRYEDFNRNFLPKMGSDRERWARVKAAVESMVGLPPIEVYQIGDAYFVLDGNHRVSIARQNNAEYIQAYVTEFKTKVPLSPNDEIDDILIKAGYTDFLEQTGLDELYPDLDFMATAPGRYEQLLDHISVHRYFMGVEEDHEIPYRDAVISWMENVYLPVIAVIRKSGILRDFPDRTETDLYLWLLRHRDEMAKRLGWQVKPEEAAVDLIKRLTGKVASIGPRAEELVEESDSETDLLPSQPQASIVVPRTTDCLFSAILVPISDEDVEWKALEQAILIAQRECAVIRGLYVVPTEEDKYSKKARAVKKEFEKRCKASEITGELVFEVGSPAHQISQRAVWSDLVVLNVFHPPADEPLARLRSGLREIIQQSPRPVLAVPSVSAMKTALLAYDGSPKAKEAMYLGVYLAKNWGVKISAVGNTESSAARRKSEKEVRDYFKAHDAEVEFIKVKGPVDSALLIAAEQHHIDLLLMGGYGLNPLMQVMLGSTVDKMLRAFKCPIMICR